MNITVEQILALFILAAAAYVLLRGSWVTVKENEGRFDRLMLHPNTRSVAIFASLLSLGAIFIEGLGNRIPGAITQISGFSDIANWIDGRVGVGANESAVLLTYGLLGVGAILVMFLSRDLSRVDLKGIRDGILRSRVTGTLMLALGLLLWIVPAYVCGTQGIKDFSDLTQAVLLGGIGLGIVLCIFGILNLVNPEHFAKRFVSGGFHFNFPFHLLTAATVTFGSYLCATLNAYSPEYLFANNCVSIPIIAVGGIAHIIGFFVVFITDDQGNTLIPPV